MPNNEELLLAVLNTAPREAGATSELLEGPPGVALAREHGGTGSTEELSRLRQVRDAIQRLIHGETAASAALQSLIHGARLTPTVQPDRIQWHLEAPDDMLLAARTAHAWSEVNERSPGRLKACANTECNLYLIDRTRPGTARWCSMATCGNRMKARAHASRRRAATER